MRRVKKGWALALSLAVLSVPGPLKSFTQTPQPAATGSVAGVVLDQQGKPIPDANVYALLEEDMRRPIASTTTDSAGKFLLADVPAAVIYIYSYKESDGYLHGFSNFFAVPNDQSLLSVKVGAGQITGVTIKRGARAAHLKFNVTDENGRRLGVTLMLTRDDQPGQFYRTGITGEETMMVPPVPFRLTLEEAGHETWNYGGANYAGKAGLITLKSGETLNLAVRLRKK
jgi:hypothetical protein